MPNAASLEDLRIRRSGIARNADDMLDRALWLRLVQGARPRLRTLSLAKHVVGMPWMRALARLDALQHLRLENMNLDDTTFTSLKGAHAHPPTLATW